MTTATMTPAQAAQALLPYVRPGFAQQFRAMGKEVGYRQLGRSLRWLAVPETNGHKETVVVSPKPKARKGMCECEDAHHHLAGRNPGRNANGGLRVATSTYKPFSVTNWGTPDCARVPSDEEIAAWAQVFRPSRLVPSGRWWLALLLPSS